METTECSGAMGALFGHRFRPRYSDSVKSMHDFVGRDNEMKCRLGGSTMLEVMDRLREKRYECDVCTRCGAIARREKA